MAKSLPKYRLHRATGLAVVTLGGKDFYLGKHDSPESYREYAARLAEFAANGKAGKPSGKESTVADLASAFMTHAASHYVKRGRTTSKFDEFNRICDELVELYGTSPISEFAPSRLKAIRSRWVDRGASRTTCNQYTSGVREVFRWGTENELVPIEVFQAIKTVRGLAAGRTEAKDSGPVLPVPQADIEKVLAVVNARVGARIRLQLLTGMRPGEVCSIRTADLDRSRPVWIYTPDEHKTEHKGKVRLIPIGPEAQKILTPFLDEANPARRIMVKCKPVRGRKTPTPAQRLANSYWQVIARACERSGCEHWHPNQLRHNAATEIRKRFGLEAAQQILGHSSTDMTEIYAEKNLDIALKVASQMG